MGLLIKGDIETNVGPTNSIYCRIESYKVQIPRAQVQFTVQYWQDKESADGYTGVYEGDNRENTGHYAYDIVNHSEVLIYKDSTPSSIELPKSIKSSPRIEKELMVPTYEKKVVTKEVPYISFDENGDEIVLTRKVDTLERVLVKERATHQQYFDRKVLNNFPVYCYMELKQHLKDYFENSNVNLTIEDV